jgi:gamma-glutamylcyclotransferase (GGCT)/AIG2-like uncharacterized protein YtfP
MVREIDTLFVYGTLLQGERRNHHLDGCKLIHSVEIPGKLYDTGKGYPTASFDGDSKESVTGEVYAISGDVNKKLKELDEIEGTNGKLYKRKPIHNGHRFYVYEAGELLKNSLRAENRINSGSWRRHGSIALKYPVEFAIRFENSQKQRYREFPLEDSSGLTFLRGEIPFLVMAPHATGHLRMGKLKYQEEYTGALSVILHTLTGSYSLYTHWASSVDPNFYDNAPFKSKLLKVVRKFGIRFVFDLHGTRSGLCEDLYPGVGNDREFLFGDDFYLYKLQESAESNGLILGGLYHFPASVQMTVTKFVSRNLGIPAMQIEISERLRQPEINPSEFEKLVKCLTEYICSIKWDMV